MHMRCGGGGHMGHHGGGGYQMVMPMIPAPVAFCAMIFGVAMGLVIARKKSMMHGMGGGMMHGMGGYEGDWMARKKMMYGMMGHHHHGYGMPPCGCGDEGQGGEEGEAPAKPEAPPAGQ